MDAIDAEALDITVGKLGGFWSGEFWIHQCLYFSDAIRINALEIFRETGFP